MTEKPMDVDLLFRSRPELFPHPLRSLEMRRTVFVGEKVKILTGIREREQLTAGRWLVVESISHTESGLQYFGRSDWHVDKSDMSFTFGPENIYRMEPRRFFIWARVEFQSQCVAVMALMVKHLLDHWMLKRTLSKNVKT